MILTQFPTQGTQNDQIDSHQYNYVNSIFRQARHNKGLVDVVALPAVACLFLFGMCLLYSFSRASGKKRCTFLNTSLKAISTVLQLVSSCNRCTIGHYLDLFMAFWCQPTSLFVSKIPDETSAGFSTLTSCADHLIVHKILLEKYKQIQVFTLLCLIVYLWYPCSESPWGWDQLGWTSP